METVVNLSLDTLHESPSNPRKYFDQAGLQELANSLLSQGVMSPIVVRPHPAPTLALHHEIVFGHRRFRAAKLAELDAMPCIVRHLTDQQVAQAQLHENLERQDVTMLEEAEAFASLMTDHHVKVEALEEQTGKSRAYIYAALQLTKLTPEARQLVNEGKIGREIAQRLGRVPASLQAAAIKAISYKEYSTSETLFHSSRQALAALKNFTMPLASAKFDTEAVNVEAWKGGQQESPNCTQCHHNSSNNAALLEDLGAGACTNRPCFDKRTKAHEEAELLAVTARIQAWKDAGKLAIEGEARHQVWPIGYPRPLTHTCIDDDLTDDSADGTIREALASMGDTAPATALIQHPRIPADAREYIQDDDIPKLLAHLGLSDPDEEQSTPTPAARADTGGAADAEDDSDAPAGQLALPWTPEEQACRSNWPPILKAMMRAAVGRRRTVEELRLIVALAMDPYDDIPEDVAEAMGWTEELAGLDAYGEDLDWLTRKLPTMPADELAAFLVVLALAGGQIAHLTFNATRAAAQVALAKSYGIDPLNPDAPAPAEAASTPPPAAQAPKGVLTAAWPLKPAASANAELDLGEPSASQEGDDQAGFAGKAIEGAGSAVAPAAATGALAGEAA